MKRIIICTFVAAIFCSCDADVLGLISPTGDTINKRFEQSMEWNEANGSRSVSIPVNEYKFHIGSDIHTKETTDNIRAMISDMRNDDESHFALLLGDVIHGKGNYPTFADALKFDSGTQSENDPVFLTVGNHDLYFGQWTEFKKYWGTSTYYFTVITPDFKDLFICLDTGTGTLGSKQMQWLKKTLKEESPRKRHIVIFTHTDLFRTDNSGFPTSNMPIEETFDITSLMQEYGVDLYLQGHNHFRHDNLYRGTRYITVDAMKDEAAAPYYMVATLSDTISYIFKAI